MMLTTIQDDRRVGVGRESTDAEGTQGDRNEEDTKVNRLRNLTILPHEASVDVFSIGEDRLAGNQVSETRKDLTTVVEDGVGDGSGINRKEYAVDESVAGGEVSWRIGLVTCFVESCVFVQDLRDLITVTGVVPNTVIVDWDVSGVPGVCVPNAEDDGGREEGTEETVEGAIEWADEGVPCDGKLVPVPGGNGVEAKAADTASDRSQVDVIRGDPGHPVEIGQGLDNVVGKPEVDEHGGKTVHEPSHPRDDPSVNDLVVLCVEGTLYDN